MVFDTYANYYDLLYKDKDYEGEVEYIDKIIKKYTDKANSILDLGCGTGKHAELLSHKGYFIHGVDASEKMLEKANLRARYNSKIQFTLSNIQDFNLKVKFDVVTALFHVMSYLNDDDSINQSLKNIYYHLKEGGIFIFDCWYGPAVLYQRPEIRIKRLSNNDVELTRIAEPVIKENKNVVEVNYDIFIKNNKDNKIFEIKEVHSMRYFFMNEIKQFINKNNFKILDCFEFMSNSKLSKNTWGSCFVLKK